MKLKKHQLRSDREKGFTFIELIIVVTILLLLAVAGAPLFGNLQVSSQLNENSTQIVQTARIARQRSVVWLNDSAHGIYFDIDGSGNDEYVLYQGSSYGTRDASLDATTTLDSPLSLSTSLAEGTTNDVNFSKGLGIPSATGTVTLTHDVSGTKTIIFSIFGKIEE